jgi:hypothetical protein
LELCKKSYDEVKEMNISKQDLRDLFFVNDRNILGENSLKDEGDMISREKWLESVLKDS